MVLFYTATLFIQSKELQNCNTLKTFHIGFKSCILCFHSLFRFTIVLFCWLLPCLNVDTVWTISRLPSALVRVRHVQMPSLVYEIITEHTSSRSGCTWYRNLWEMDTTTAVHLGPQDSRPGPITITITPLSTTVCYCYDVYIIDVPFPTWFTNQIPKFNAIIPLRACLFLEVCYQQAKPHK